MAGIATYFEQRRCLAARRSNQEGISLQSLQLTEDEEEAPDSIAVRRSNQEGRSPQFTEDEDDEEVEEEAPDFTRSHVSQVGFAKETRAVDANGNSALPLQDEKPPPDTENLLEENEEPEESSTLRAGGATTTPYEETEPTLFRKCLLLIYPAPLN